MHPDGDLAPARTCMPPRQHCPDVATIILPGFPKELLTWSPLLTPSRTELLERCLRQAVCQFLDSVTRAEPVHIPGVESTAYQPEAGSQDGRTVPYIDKDLWTPRFL